MSKKLSDVAEVIDSLHATPEYTEDGYSMVRVVDINNSFLHLDKCFKVDKETCDKHNKNHIPKKGDIIITRVGSYGMMAFVDTDEEFCLGQNIAIISPKTNSKYLYYYLQSPYMQSIIYGKSGGSSYKCIGLEDIRNFPFESNGVNCEKVGELLYEIDAKIENNNKINAELESMAKTIYDYWFLQFEFPNEEGKPYKSSGGKMVWNEELKREIPKGWEAGQLNQLGDLLMGQSPKSESYNDKEIGYPLINGAAELQANKIEITKYTSEPTRVCKINDLLFCIRATIGNLRYSEAEYCLGRGVAAFTPKKSEYAEYAFDLLNNILEIYKKILTGSIIVGITKDDLSEKLIVIPNEAVIKKYSLILKPVHDKIRKNQKENQELTLLRDFLLPMLMNGQVGFKDGE